MAASDTEPERDVPPLGLPETRRLLLRPPVSGDLDTLYLMATTGSNAYRWRYRGATPPFDVFARQLWEGVLAQYIVIRKRDALPQGIVTLYNANANSGYVYASMSAAPQAVGTGSMMEGLFMALKHAFDTWSFRRIYFEVSAFNLPQFESGVRRGYAVEVGRLPDHEVLFGRTWDLIILMMTFEMWKRGPEPVLMRLV